MSILKLEHISKKFDNVSVVDDFSLESMENEFIVLVGPSGCGKTTLLRMIAGLTKPSMGAIWLNDSNITDLDSQYRDIAMVFQSYALYPNMTVFDNLSFPLILRNEKKDVIKEKVSNIAQKMELTDLLNRKPRTLSGGQRQRVAIGRAMIREPRVFLLDEPLSNLDASLREKMREELVALHSRLNAIFVYVTHDQVEAMAMGDRIIVMNKGIIQQIDTPRKIYNKPSNTFVAEFIGSPKMNFISKHMLSMICPRILIDSKVKTVGIRPEHITIKKSSNFESNVGKISHIEMLGKETNYIITYQNETIHACQINSDDMRLNVGDEVCCSISQDKLHFFGADGKRINE